MDFDDFFDLSAASEPVDISSNHFRATVEDCSDEEPNHNPFPLPDHGPYLRHVDETDSGDILHCSTDMQLFNARIQTGRVCAVSSTSLDPASDSADPITPSVATPADERALADDLFAVRFGLRSFSLTAGEHDGSFDTSIAGRRLNMFYEFHSCYSSLTECRQAFKFCNMNRIRVRPHSLSQLVLLYRWFSNAALKQLLAMHNIDSLGSDTKPTLLKSLLDHKCGDSCDFSGIVYVFESRYHARQSTGSRIRRSSIDRVSAERVAARLVREAASNLRAQQRTQQSIDEERARAVSEYPYIASVKHWQQIITAWQERYKTSSFRSGVCAVCSLSELKSDKQFEWYNHELIDLDLLRNDMLPSEARPASYDFELYQRAILNPKGMMSKSELADLLLCATCKADLVNKSRMPELALANWLYYGHDCLSPSVSRAFDEASVFEKMLVSRCSASKIIHRFSEKKGSINEGEAAVTSQRYNQGNTIIMPQDCISLNSCLPPGPETVKDTMCALFVGSEKPTPDNIAKLSPVLVRKSRVKTMIQFLVSRNAHYSVLDGFQGLSETNLAALFENNDTDEAVPSQIDTQVIAADAALNSSSQSYTDRDELDPEVMDSNDSEVLMENVGYTEGDQSYANYEKMKIDAIQHCLKGGTYVNSQRGSTPVPDFTNPHLLTWLFPHLDPFGVGGFFEPRRKRKLTLEKQIRHLLMLDNSPFERDANFAFVFYNIMQKRSVVEAANFRIKEGRHIEIVRELMGMKPESLDALSQKFVDDAHAAAGTDSEQQALDVLSQLNMVCKDLPRTSAYKQCRRNEIRGLINKLGSPALFITINPSDIDDPIVRLLVGDQVCLEDATVGEQLSRFQRSIKVAKNPGAVALFFDRIISDFIKIILRPSTGYGLFGKCSAYYGMVEAQGKGTLHCHMLIWLDGHLSPQTLRDKMDSDVAFKGKMFEWLESIIKCELPSNDSVVNEDSGQPIPRPPRKKPSPTMLPAPRVDSDDFQQKYDEFVEQLVCDLNWHVHKATCWKYLKEGEPRDDNHCRMRMDGKTRERTTIDAETESILLRRFHPRISNYNDLITFLLKCNNDIKFIGSGEAAKALIYYITDYITKQTLPTHAGLAALAYAVRMSNVQYEESDRSDKRAKNLVTKSINAMMARQEVSHQQVMSYLIGGGDCYKSHQFATLHWGSFDRHVRLSLKETSISIEKTAEQGADDVDECQDDSDEVELPEDGNAAEDLGNLYLNFGKQKKDIPLVDDEIDEDDPEIETEMAAEQSPRSADACSDKTDWKFGSISASNMMKDYRLRCESTAFEDLCVYDFVAKVQKITKKEEESRLSNPAHHRCKERGHFREEHPQSKSHMLRFRTTDTVPVILGPTIARKDAGSVALEKWSRAMLIIFKPWRDAVDLKEADETWQDAFNRTSFSAEHQQIMRNMSVLTECKDARDRDAAHRHAERKNRSTSEGRYGELGLFLLQDQALDDNLDADGGLAASTTTANVEDFNNMDLNDPASDAVYALNMAGLCNVADATSQGSSSDDTTSCISLATEKDRKIISRQAKLMAELKKKRRPAQPPSASEPHVSQCRRTGTYPDRQADTRLDAMDLDERPGGAQQMGETRANNPELSVVDQLIIDGNMTDNPEQSEAVRIVGEHVLSQSKEQLLLHVSGVGGTGKSHVINTIVQLFERLSRSDELALSAPTGIAAILINGYTIHSLTYLPKSKHKVKHEDLKRIWANVRYLIIDEISMVSAQFLAQISQRINEARRGYLPDGPCSFGNINVICTGDLGQLKPVKALSMFSHSLVKDMRISTAQSADGQEALHGAFLWRQFDRVIELKKNMRQNGDSKYAELLGRVRLGEAIDDYAIRHMASNSTDDTCDPPIADYDVLSGRDLAILGRGNATEFSDAPVIVGTKLIRDAINRAKVLEYATKTGQSINHYCSRDRVSMQNLQGEEQKRVWRVRSSVTKDAMGQIPMVPGMKVMITENIAIGNKVVNGSEGTLKSIKYEVDGEGNRYAVAAYVHIAGSRLQAVGLDAEVVPILPVRTSFKYQTHSDAPAFYISRLQLPIVPAYCYTDYKSQGRSLDKAIVDLASARSLQGVYVMLSRVKSLNGLAILRFFPPNKVNQRLSGEIREEMDRLSQIAKRVSCRSRT